MKDSVKKIPAVFLRAPQGEGPVKTKRGNLLISDTAVTFKMSPGVIKFKLKDIKYISLHDKDEARRRFPEELRTVSIDDGTFMEIKPLTLRNQPYYLFVVNQAAVQPLVDKLNSCAVSSVQKSLAFGPDDFIKVSGPGEQGKNDQEQRPGT
jgi:hypothetical protein